MIKIILIISLFQIRHKDYKTETRDDNISNYEIKLQTKYT